MKKLTFDLLCFSISHVHVPNEQGNGYECLRDWGEK